MSETWEGEDSYTQYRGELRRLISDFSGQGNTLTVPRPFIAYFGNLEAALLFSQMIYWSDRSTLADRWFWKTYDQWQEELGLSEYQVRKAVKKIGETVPPLIATEIRKAQGNPTVHYQVLWDNFSESLVKFLQERNRSNSRNESKETSETLHKHRLLTETTTEITTAPKGLKTLSENGDQTVWPEWYSLLYGVPGFKTAFTQAETWRVKNGISEDLAERKAYALRDWWPRQPKSRTRAGDPYLTWTNWCREDKSKGGANGKPGGNPPTDREAEAARNWNRDHPGGLSKAVLSDMQRGKIPPPGRAPWASKVAGAPAVPLPEHGGGGTTGPPAVEHRKDA